jgi:hypothetical protein
MSSKYVNINLHEENQISQLLPFTGMSRRGILEEIP